MMQNEIPGNAKIILMKYLEELKVKELKKFNVLLKDYPVKEGYSHIPTAKLENADFLEIAGQMIIHYQEEYALEIAGQLLYQIPRMDLYEQFKSDSQKYLDKNHKLWQTRVKDHNKNYKAYIIEKFTFMEDKNSRIGENISLNKRYTKLLIIKEHCLQAEREYEIMSSGWEHLKILAQRAEHSYSSIAALFDPDKAGHVNKTIVLQGAAGIGKTMTARKIMLDWASGELFQDRFDYVFYINCREINQLSGQQTIAQLLSHSCPRMSLPMREIVANPEKLLFIIDGFDELNISVDPTADGPCTMTQNDNTIMSSIKEIFFSKSYIIITTRPTALEKLRECVVASRFAEILGFSEEDRKEYFMKFFNSEKQGAQAFNIVKGNDTLFTMCFVPIVCWIVCTVIKQQMEKNEDIGYALRTTTSLYMSFLSSLLNQQSRDSVQPIHRNLQRLCALAEHGICQQKILFEEKDLIKHGLAIPAVQSLFLKNDIFQKDTECENCYSFIHMSFQEFFAAMFYVLSENEGTRAHTVNPIRWVQRKLTHLRIIKPRAMSLLEASRKQKQFTLTVRFLFGLLNTRTLSQMENRFHWTILPDIKPALLKWIKKGMKQDFSNINNEQMELFRCLHEIQDKDFVKRGTRHLKEIAVSSYSLQREVNCMDFRALGFCLMHSSGVERVNIHNTEMKPEDLRALIPGLMTCVSLRLEFCSLSDSCCADLSSVLRTNSSLTELSLGGNKLLDSGVIELCEGLKHPSCRLQALRLWGNKLTDASTEALCSALHSNQRLQCLVLSWNPFTESSAAAFSEFKGRVTLPAFW